MPNERCKDKVSHPSRGKAEAALRAILKVQPDYDDAIYPCTICKGFHIGRLKANAHRNKFKAKA